jgi:small-conductance mechanosensitive channel
MHKNLWLQASIRLIPCVSLFVGGIIINTHYGDILSHTFDKQLISILGMLIFAIFAILSLHVTTRLIKELISTKRLGVGQAASIQFLMHLVGYIAILLIALDLLDIPVGRLLLGGAVLGIILGVAAQQALANFFASIVLIISHPFAVGDHIVIHSGALGGKYAGSVEDIGLTHTILKEKNGNTVYLPNATLLSGAAISDQTESQ